jgi:hypothetical protein
MSIPKMRVSWREDRRRWEVWEEYRRGSAKHHSFHRTEGEARSAARAQAIQDKKDVAKPKPKREIHYHDLT